MPDQDPNTPPENPPSAQPNPTSPPLPGTLPSDQTQRIQTLPLVDSLWKNIASLVWRENTPEAHAPTNSSAVTAAVPPNVLTAETEAPIDTNTAGTEATLDSRTVETATSDDLVIALPSVGSVEKPEAVDPPPSLPPQTKPLVGQWLDREPIDPTFEVDHIHTKDLEGSRGWRISGASRRGKMHAHEAKYREDAWLANVSRKKGWCMVAVADGGGSYDLARVGSHTAVKAAIESLIEKLPEQEFLDPAIRGAMSETLTDAYHALEHQASAIAAKERPNTTSRDLSTTLLLFAFCPHKRKLVVAQVGDGLIALQKADGTYVKLAEGDAGEVAGATIFLNNIKSQQWSSRIRLYNLQEMPRMIVAMTDGVSDDVLDSEEQNTRTLFDALTHFTRERSPSQAICNWLAYDKKGSFDDRTLVVVYPRQ